MKRILKMMKARSLLLIFLLCFWVQAFAQDIVLDNNIEMDNSSYTNEVDISSKKIFYRHFKENQIIRFEEDKVQLYNEKFEKLWEVDIPKVKATSNENTYIFQIINNNIYVLQRGLKPGHIKNCLSRLHIITEDGKKKTIELGDIAVINDLTAVKLIDDAIYVFLKGYFENEPKTTYSDCIVLKLSAYGKLTARLNVSYKHQGVKGAFWRFFGIEDGEIMYYTTYYINKNGKTSSIKSNGDDELKGAILTLDEDLNFISEESLVEDNDETDDETDDHQGMAIKDDDKNTTIELNKIKIKLKEAYSFSAFKGIELSINGKTSTTLVEEVVALCGDDIRKNAIESFTFIDAIADPVNNSINIVTKLFLKVSSTPVNLILVLDEDLKLKSIIVFQIKSLRFLSSYYATRHLGFEYSKFIRRYGSFDENHKQNALEYATEHGEKGVYYTIFNRGSQQLLFVDNKKTKTTTVKIFE